MAFSESRDWGFGIGDSQRRIHDSDCSRTRHYQCSKVGDCFSESPIPNPESQFLGGLPVLSMCPMRAWVFSCCASSTKCLRSEERRVGNECVSTCRFRLAQYN